MVAASDRIVSVVAGAECIGAGGAYAWLGYSQAGADWSRGILAGLATAAVGLGVWFIRG